MLYVYLLICVPFVLNYLFCSESNAQQSKNITSECIVKSVPDYRTGKELATLTTLWLYLAIALIKYIFQHLSQVTGQDCSVVCKLIILLVERHVFK